MKHGDAMRHQKPQKPVAMPRMVGHMNNRWIDQYLSHLAAPSSSLAFVRAAGASKASDSLWAVEARLGAPLIHDSLALGLLFLLPYCRVQGVVRFLVGSIIHDKLIHDTCSLPPGLLFLLQ